MDVYVLIAVDVSQRKRYVNAPLPDELHVAVPDDGGVLRQLLLAHTEVFRDRQEEVLHADKPRDGGGVRYRTAQLGGIHQQSVPAYQDWSRPQGDIHRQLLLRDA